MADDTDAYLKEQAWREAREQYLRSYLTDPLGAIERLREAFGPMIEGPADVPSAAIRPHLLSKEP